MWPTRGTSSDNPPSAYSGVVGRPGAEVYAVSHRGSLKGYSASFGAVALATLVCFLIDRRLDSSNQVMVYLLAVTVVASRFGPPEAIFTSVLSVAVFDVAFVEPRGSFTVAVPHQLVTFAVMLAVGLIVSGLTLRLRIRTIESAQRERLTNTLYLLSRDLAHRSDVLELAKTATESAREVLAQDSVILLESQGRLEVIARSETSFEDQGKVEECYRLGHRIECGAVIYACIRGSSGPLGVLGVVLRDTPTIIGADLVATFANTLGLAVERADFARQSQEAKVLAEGEKIRSALLSSISHDLRTPLTAIAGAASTLLMGQGDSGQLAQTIYDESLHMNLHVQNLLDMTRLQSGMVRPKCEWMVLEEVVGTAIARTSELLGTIKVRANLDPELPMLWIDAGLVEKVFTNLFENVVQHAKGATEITINSEVLAETIRINVADNGAGIPAGSEIAIFERYAQGSESSGFGLGLAIARAVMTLHSGHITAGNGPSGGTVFHIEFPKPACQPEVPIG